MVREGSTAKNLKDLLPLIHSKNSRRFFWVTDDRHPKELIEEGHIDSMIRQAIRLGLDPILAIQMATLNVAEYFRLDDLGAIAPGFKADLVSFDHLREFRIKKVFKDGLLIAEEGRLLPKALKRIRDRKIRESIHIGEIDRDSFLLRSNQPWAKVIQLIPGQIITKKVMKKIILKDGVAYPNPEEDLLKIAVVERHRGTGNIGVGFVQGFGLKEGAIGSSVAHDSHNIIVVGTNDEEMLRAVQGIQKMGGGLIVISKGKVLASLPLPIGGLMAEVSVDRVYEKWRILDEKVRELGGKLVDPFMALSFLSLPVIPELKITDKGLVDVNQFKIVPVFGEE